MFVRVASGKLIPLCRWCWINHYTTELQGLTWKISLKAALFMQDRVEEVHLIHFTHSVCAPVMLLLRCYWAFCHLSWDYGVSSSVCFDWRLHSCRNCICLISYTIVWIHLFKRFAAKELKNLLAAEQTGVALLSRQRNQHWEWKTCTVFTAINVINSPFTFTL